ncbi:PREDICTED: hexosaminidase D-like [Pseudopodoces humilis]|uniref:hexosaminidase D-like n=1 Tax=Pseudopodoces humilis TaxID=181119 RepID=UPI0006B86A09|nr:PREDICTED: hexosaminidase D-like [Pseudopodoces humilis]
MSACGSREDPCSSRTAPAGAEGLRAATLTPPVPVASPEQPGAWVAPNHLFPARRDAARDATPSIRPVTRPLARGGPGSRTGSPVGTCSAATALFAPAPASPERPEAKAELPLAPRWGTREIPEMAFQRSHRLNLLRLVVLLLVALGGIKFLFRDSFTLELHKHVSKDSGFWGDTGDVVQDIIPHSQVLEVPAAKITALKQKQQVPRDVSATEMRLVHLDLKGAAPRVSYLEQVLPLLSQLGANGVLIEYEDMFPFKGELEILRSPYAYSEEDIERIQQLAEQHKLEVVPLVQTFGHVEFILKHQKYQHLREVERFPNSFNPHVPDTLALLKSILSQVIEKHRRSTWIHIGADEVFHLGEGMDSKNWMSHNKGDVGTMYLKHIKEVLGFLTAQYWGLRVLMWDDMLRKISVGALRESGIAKHVSPVVWFYAPDFEAEQIVPFLTKYVESGFEAVWFASAFKGTTGPAQAWTPLSYHLKNHLSWLKVMQAVPRLAPLRLQGVVLTGWQRYDHYSVLCELLPVSIPSLAICLQTLVNGGFTEEAKRKVLDVLGLESVQLEQSTCEGRGVFPGVEIYHMVEQVNGHLKESILKALEEESAIKGWFSPYHRKRQFGNPRNMESFGSKVLKLHEDWESFVRDLRAQLERIYFPDTVEEWMEENINPYLDQLRDLVRDYRAIIRLNARPKAT